ncbi:metallophosphoesterase, partial [Acidobacteria bacterium AH-259-L09]|nr:metallophosphoesterase [Acidobacteria bacterium AH-259-L09]
TLRRNHKKKWNPRSALATVGSATELERRFCYHCLMIFPGMTLRARLGVISFLFWLVISLGFVPVLGGEKAEVRFAVIGDSGTGGKYQYRIAREMVAWHNRLPYNLTLMLGDNIYGGFLGQGGGNKKDFEKKFDRPYAELLARGVIFRAALGNHDMNRREGRDLIEAYDRFHIDGKHGYYSFTEGKFAPGFSSEVSAGEKKRAPLIEFLVLNTERLKKGDPAQITWLKQALAASRARWRIVYAHHPLYSTGKGWFHGGNEDLRQQLEPLFLGSSRKSSSRRTEPSLVDPMPEPRVHVVLAGHDHIYQRFHPQKGVFHFVCGSSGKLSRNGAGYSPQVAAIEDQRRVFMLWEVTPRELRFSAINEKGQAFDCGFIGGPGRLETVSCCVRSSNP